MADEYFHHHVGEKRGFTHHMGCANGKNIEATFYLYYNSGDIVDVQGEMKK